MRRHTALIDAITKITDNQGRTNKHEQRPRRFELEVMLSPIRNAADKLPDDKKRQLRTAIKGMLLAISQEQLDEGE
ncbi:TPA: hypothetical protein VDT41_006419 [Pseudomonas aeruginosa]|nr:hypothetical protein [Pseudomonas aeruginosa]